MERMSLRVACALSAGHARWGSHAISPSEAQHEAHTFLGNPSTDALGFPFFRLRRGYSAAHANQGPSRGNAAAQAARSGLSRCARNAAAGSPQPLERGGYRLFQSTALLGTLERLKMGLLVVRRCPNRGCRGRQTRLACAQSAGLFRRERSSAQERGNRQRRVVVGRASRAAYGRAPIGSLRARAAGGKRLSEFDKNYPGKRLGGVGEE